LIPCGIVIALGESLRNFRLAFPEFKKKGYPPCKAV